MDVKLVAAIRELGGTEALAAWRQEHPGENPDLKWADLTGADLSRANLSRTDLWGADLTGADLTGAKLWGADLSRADLTGAKLWGARNVPAEILDEYVKNLRASVTVIEVHVSK